MEKKLSSEEDFLLNLMEFEIDPAKKEKIISLINQGVDWMKLSKVAQVSGLAPLFYKNFQALNLIDYLPDDLVQRFKNRYVKTLFENSKKIKYFELIVSELNKNNIDFIPLKGIYLIPTFYKDFGLRTMCDIDILVRFNDVEKCKDVFLEQGWKITKDIYQTESVKKLNLVYTPYILTKDGIMLELHQKLFETGAIFNVPIEDLWERSRTQDFLNGNSYQLSNEDLLLHQVLHLYKHFIIGQISFKSFIDIKLLLKKSNHLLNESNFLELVQKYNCKHEVSVINKLMKTYFSVEIYCQNEIQISNSEFDIYFIFRNLLNLEFEKTRDYIDVNKIFYLRSMDIMKHVQGSKDTFNYILGNLFPDRQFMYRRYQFNQPYKLVYYYIYRLFSVLKNKYHR